MSKETCGRAGRRLRGAWCQEVSHGGEEEEEDEEEEFESIAMKRQLVTAHHVSSSSHKTQARGSGSLRHPLSAPLSKDST